MVDLPPDALHLIAAVIPNLDLDIAVGVSHARKEFRRTFPVEARRAGQESEAPLATWNLSHWCLHYWLARYCAARGIALEWQARSMRLLNSSKQRLADSLLPADMTPAQWRAFLDDYFRVVDFAYLDRVPDAQAERRRKNVLRKYGVTLPDDIEEDDHSRTCRMCIAGLYQHAYRITGFFEYAPLRSFLHSMPKKSGYQRLPEDIDAQSSYVNCCRRPKTRRAGNTAVTRPATARGRRSHRALFRRICAALLSRARVLGLFEA